MAQTHAFKKLIGDLTRRPVERDSADDVLFHDRDAAPNKVRTDRAFEVALPRSADDTHPVTLRVRRHDEHIGLAKLALPMGLLIVLGVLIGLAITSKSKSEAEPAKPEPATSAAASSAPVAKPTPAPTAPPIPPAPSSTNSALLAATTPSAPPPAAEPAKPKLVEVRLESTPPGANVTLVDDGSVSLLGKTPIDASVDPSRRYEVVFALDAHPTKVVHLDPAKSLSVAVTLDTPKPARPARKSRHRAAKR